MKKEVSMTIFIQLWPQSTYFMNKHFCMSNISIYVYVFMYTYVTYVDINLYLGMFA